MGAVSLAERGITVGEVTMGEVVPLRRRRAQPELPQLPEPSGPIELPVPTEPSPEYPPPAARTRSVTELSIRANIVPERPRPARPIPEPAPPIPRPKVAGEIPFGIRGNPAERSVGNIGAKVTELRPGVPVSLAKPAAPQRRVA